MSKPVFWVEYPMDCAQSVGKWEGVEIGPRWESPSILLTNACQGHQHRIRDCEVGKCAEATQGSYCCKLFHPLSDRRSVVGGFDTTGEDIEAACNKGGVWVGQCCYCKVIQGRQTDWSIQRRPECPRDAVQVQHSYWSLRYLLRPGVYPTRKPDQQPARNLAGIHDQPNGYKKNV